MAKKQRDSREIIALDDHEHVLLRPTMWVGTIAETEEKIPLVKDGMLISDTKKISVGFYKMMNEILDNSFDEAKRLKGKMPKIEIRFNSKTSEVSITDFGEGFYKGTQKNIKTGKSNIETAMTELRAGTNFFNQDSEETLIGTNGVGASLVNILSTEFTIRTTNKDYYFSKSWNNFKDNKTEKRKRKRTDKLGTTISFIPRDSAVIQGETTKLFKDCKWDKEYVHTLMLFRNFIRKQDSILKDLEFVAYFDDKKLDLDIDFLPENKVIHKTRMGVFIMWKRYENSTSVSFVNGAQCTGIHQKIFNDWVNDVFDYNLAHHFYETLVLLDVPAKFIRFADQNKTKYAVGRGEIEEDLERVFKRGSLSKLKKSTIYGEIQTLIDEKLFNENLKEIKKKKKASKKKISDKYFAPSSKKGMLLITEGSSASGGILQARDPKVDGIYTLKGKVKNAKRITDLSNNNEIIDLMSILEIEPKSSATPSYDKIVFAVDADPDGSHISSLLINLFFKWFPHIVESGKLYILITPIVSVDSSSKRVYYYTLDEYKKAQDDGKINGKVRYLKGLGSLDKKDWDWVMSQKRMFKIYKDRSSTRFMEIAFGSSSDLRKKWLQN